MRLEDVKVGMRLKSIFNGREVTVTELTEKGFKYSYDQVVSLIPRRGLSLAKDGHEHYVINGEVLYEPVLDGQLSFMF